MQHPSTCSCSRRSFLRGCGLTLTGFGIASLFPEPFIRHAMANVGDTNKRLLFIFMRGGNDGINTVIPHGDMDYNPSVRGSLFIPQASPINLQNDFASLHPAMSYMMDAFNQNELAVIHRVGYENNTRSHFDGQRIWENGDPTQTNLFEGWLYRYVEECILAAGGDLPVVTTQPTPPLLIKGSVPFTNIANPDDFGYLVPGTPKAEKFGGNWKKLFGDLVGLEAYRPILSQTGVKLKDTLDEYDSWDHATWNPTDPNSGWSLFPVSFETNPDDPANPGQKLFSDESYAFFNSLKIAALALLESDGSANNGTRIAGTQLGGWDLHNNQGATNGRHAELLSWLAYGFQSLRTVFSGAAIDPRNYSSIWDDTIVTTLSEFGRTSRVNGAAGTDHAAASCLFVQGGCVSGGVYNCDDVTWGANQGVMFDVDGRYLKERTDYRSIFWEILRDHMGASGVPVETIFPGYASLGLGSGELGIFAPCPAEIDPDLVQP